MHIRGTWFFHHWLMGHSSTDRPGVNIIMSAISIKIATIGQSWALITNIKSVFEYILPFQNYSSKVTPPDHIKWLYLKLLFQSLRACQRHIKDLNSLKLAGCNTDIGIYELYISDFVYRWPQVMSFSWPSHYKSMAINRSTSNAHHQICPTHPESLYASFGNAKGVATTPLSDRRWRNTVSGRGLSGFWSQWSDSTHNWSKNNWFWIDSWFNSELFTSLVQTHIGKPLLLKIHADAPRLWDLLRWMINNYMGLGLQQVLFCILWQLNHFKFKWKFREVGPPNRLRQMTRQSTQFRPKHTVGEGA